MPNIILTGFMGSGKSHLLPLLSKRLKCKAFDLDVLIEDYERQSITDLISDSEAYFRKLELHYCRHVINTNSDFVLALGGGAFCQPEIQTYILSDPKNIVLYLSLSDEDFDQRMEKIKTQRPILQAFGNQYKTKAKALYEFRKKSYQKAHIQLDSSSSLDYVIQQIEALN